MLKGKLEGFRLSIVDEAVVEDLGFSGDSVVATIGATQINKTPIIKKNK